MRRHGVMALGLLLAVGIHADWHLARPHHHRLSLEWREHWPLAATLLALTGCIVARPWPRERWPLGAGTLAIGIGLAQLVEPVAEAASSLHRLAYPVEAARWRVLSVCLAVGIPAFALALWLSAPPVHARSPGRGASRLATP